jgi:hypothetical protein
LNNLGSRQIFLPPHSHAESGAQVVVVHGSVDGGVD